MIKLIKLLELEKPQNIYAPEQEPGEAPEKDLMKKGFKLGKATIDPETGASVTDVTYLPAFETIRRQTLSMRKEFQPFKFSSNEDIAKVAKDINTNMRKEFQPFKFSSNEDIAKVAKDINTNLTKVSQMIFALEKMIELQNKSK